MNAVQANIIFKKKQVMFASHLQLIWTCVMNVVQPKHW